MRLDPLCSRLTSPSRPARRTRRPRPVLRLELLEDRRVPATISGTVFNDLDGDGVRDPGEPGLAGRTVTLYAPAGPVAREAVTDAAGNYQFTNLPALTYTVQPTGRAGWPTTAPAAGAYVVSLANGATASGRDFGLHGDGAAPAATITVTPNLRTTPVDSIAIVFSEVVTGLDLSDLRLTRFTTEIPLTGLFSAA